MARADYGDSSPTAVRFSSRAASTSTAGNGVLGTIRTRAQGWFEVAADVNSPEGRDRIAATFTSSQSVTSCFARDC